MKLKKKYILILIAVMCSMPISTLLINVIVVKVYKVISASESEQIPFHESLAYPMMYVLFGLSFFLLAFVFSKSIHSLLNKITILNKTIKNLAENESIPETVDIQSDDEIGELIKSVNLLIERTTYREMVLD